jgi:uncharacterized FlaG/YvyC family protein
MKIGSNYGIPALKPKIENTGTGQEGHSNQAHTEGRQNRDDNRSKEDGTETKREQSVEVTEETLKAALEKFSADQAAAANHLSATMTGTGPGLKIVLKDQTGTILRQISGEEFMKLREQSTPDVKTPGKLLDQKV